MLTEPLRCRCCGGLVRVVVGAGAVHLDYEAARWCLVEGMLPASMKAEAGDS